MTHSPWTGSIGHQLWQLLLSKNFKVSVQTDDKNPRASWQNSRPLKMLSFLTSGFLVMFVALGLEANLFHTQTEHLEKVQFPWTVPRGHIYLSITRIKISQLLQSTQLMKSCLICPSGWSQWARGRLSPALLHLPSNQGHRMLKCMFKNSLYCRSPGFINHFCSYKSTSINAWDPRDSNMGRQGEKLTFPTPGPPNS